MALLYEWTLGGQGGGLHSKARTHTLFKTQNKNTQKLGACQAHPTGQEKLKRSFVAEGKNVWSRSYANTLTFSGLKLAAFQSSKRHWNISEASAECPRKNCLPFGAAILKKQHKTKTQSSWIPGIIWQSLGTSHQRFFSSIKGWETHAISYMFPHQTHFFTQSARNIGCLLRQQNLGGKKYDISNKSLKERKGGRSHRKLAKTKNKPSRDSLPPPHFLEEAACILLLELLGCKSQNVEAFTGPMNTKPAYIVLAE